MDDLIRSVLQYLKNPGFAAKFVRAKYEELLPGNYTQRAPGGAEETGLRRQD